MAGILLSLQYVLGLYNEPLKPILLDKLHEQ